MRYRPLLTALLIVAFGELYVAGVASAQSVSKQVMDGPYSVNLKVLPAEHFKGPNAEMVREGGASPVTVNGPKNPNHHLVVFVKQNGKPVEHATVKIECRKTSPKETKWMRVPTTRMSVKGKGPSTTHYGNNVKLGAGSYEARVTVNGHTTTIPFTLQSGSMSKSQGN